MAALALLVYTDKARVQKLNFACTRMIPILCAIDTCPVRTYVVYKLY